MNTCENPEDEKTVQALLGLIEAEKRMPKPNKKLMRDWFKEIFKLRGDWRNTYTNQENRFMLHTSMRGWRDDCAPPGQEFR